VSPPLNLPSRHVRVFAKRPALDLVGLAQVDDRLELGLLFRLFRAASPAEEPNSAAFLDDVNAVAIELGSCNQASPQGKRIDFGA
jgi:hypothetical protein